MRWCAVAGIAALALTGCVRATVDTTVNADGTFSQHSVAAISDSAASQLQGMLGGGLPGDIESEVPEDFDIEALLGGAQDSPELAELEEQYPGQVEVDDYDDGELSGVEITLTDLPLDEFNAAGAQAGGALGAQATLEEVEDTYVATIAPPADLDLASAGVTEASLSLIESSVEIAVTFTFPGLVEEASAGEVDGKTVTLGLTDLAAGEEIVIVAGANDAIDWGPWLRWGGIVLAFALVIGGAAALVIQDQRKRRRSSLPPPQATESPTGPGMLSDERD
ncbi:LppM family (lipo)protein [Demequina activiva]|nr:hypothetical protein [Demequina activiva]